MNPTSPVITKLKVARLYNTGNYEHERIEITIEAVGYELQDGSHVQCHIERPGDLLGEVRSLMDTLKPEEIPIAVQFVEDVQCGRTRVRTDSEPWDGDSCTEEEFAVYQKEAEAWRERRSLHCRALARLNELGAVEIGGAK